MTNIRYTSGNISSRGKLKSIGDKMRINVVPRVVDTSSISDLNIQDMGGKIIRNVKVELILWGSNWNDNPSPTVEDLTHAVSTIVSSPYMTGLKQYRGIGPGTLEDVLVVKDPVGTSDANPPSTFTDNDIETLVTNLIRSQMVQDPHTDEEILYCVIMPIGISSSQDPDAAGKHGFFRMDNLNVRFAWVMNDGTLNSLDSVPKVFSHELVEACSDPEPAAGLDAFVIPENGRLEEIGDVCNSMIGSLNGVTMQKYYSQKDHGCILPTRFT